MLFYLVFRYSEKHNTSTAGEPAFTECGIILSDMVLALGGVGFWIVVLATISFGINQEMYDSLHPHGRRIRHLSLSGLRTFVLSTVILWLGPILASIAYYLERAPYFPQ